MSTVRPIQMALSTSRSAVSLRRLRSSGIVSRIFWAPSAGRSCATPPGRMYALFMRSPDTISKMSSTSSRSRKPNSMAVRAPSSMPPVARATRWEEMRLSSIIITRMTLARSGIWSSTPSAFSTARQ